MKKPKPRTYIPISNLALHVEVVQASSLLACNQDWKRPSCKRCYHNWLYVEGSEDVSACPGEDSVCVDYHPPFKQSSIKDNRKELRAFRDITESLTHTAVEEPDPLVLH